MINLLSLGNKFKIALIFSWNNICLFSKAWTDYSSIQVRKINDLFIIYTIQMNIFLISKEVEEN